ncbi:uncharacterized protein SCHCODRAFT_02613283 [Schizophyllum commune H4-8]|nr:uncharacterized protein SCHCODRAFT_02613283 [Schizophyllum commune H4-8]KAI5898831.1 hypothetical protein SCHCODRAFT_02613283 [Schizophyllum commune H4-8]
MSNTHKGDDPRDASLETPFRLPHTWYSENGDLFGQAGVMLSGLIAVTRNPYLGWPIALLSLNQYLNSHPMRTKEGSSGLSNVVLCACAVIASYVPMFMLQKAPQTQAA